MPEHWTDAIDDDAVRAVVGDDTFRRGAEYARAGRVQRLTGSGGGALLGEVRGSGNTVYSTLVTPFAPRPGNPRRWTSRCSCPVASDCKHAVAVLVAARTGAVGAADEATPAAGWEERVGDLVRPAPEPAREP
ncbi:SWIM zinc finger family protein, partial [Aquipuribacter hungaricus]